MEEFLFFFFWRNLKYAATTSMNLQLYILRGSSTVPTFIILPAGASALYFNHRRERASPQIMFPECVGLAGNDKMQTNEITGLMDCGLLEENNTVISGGRREYGGPLYCEQCGSGRKVLVSP